MTWQDLPFWSSETWRDIQLDLKDSDYYPKKTSIFKALVMTPLKRVRAVILGQDPYHDGSATGLAFSCEQPYLTVRPSLHNILSEYHSDLHYPHPKTGDLSSWARQGVLLLNSILTVKPGEAMSHRDLGWQTLTGQMLDLVARERPGVVFILWGKEAQDTAAQFTRGRRRVMSPHPSPLSAYRGFFGSRPFTKTNALLVNAGEKPIDWRLPD